MFILWRSKLMVQYSTRTLIIMALQSSVQEGRRGNPYPLPIIVEQKIQRPSGENNVTQLRFYFPEIPPLWSFYRFLACPSSGCSFSKITQQQQEERTLEEIQSLWSLNVGMKTRRRNTMCSCWMNYYSKMCLNFYVEKMPEIEYAAASDPRISLTL